MESVLPDSEGETSVGVSPSFSSKAFSVLTATMEGVEEDEVAADAGDGDCEGAGG